jgi:outer membrane protein OmpA-like peptidoglycan-associated protein
MNTRSRSSVLGLGTVRTLHNCLLVGFAVGLVTGLASCKDYPNCDTDSDCKPKEFCVGKKCKQCRDNRDCPDGNACTDGKCSPIEGFCRDKSQCPAGQECIANRCRPCTADGECPSGMRCNQGQCMRPQCVSDDQCAQDQECQNGFCRPATRPKSTQLCPLESVYFDFDRATLTNEATASLANNTACLKRFDKPVNLIGRADPRGTPEYNMALSDRRAQAVKEYLQRVGIPTTRLVPVPRGELDAKGADDSGWAKDRRVDSEWQ